MPEAFQKAIGEFVDRIKKENFASDSELEKEVRRTTEEIVGIDSDLKFDEMLMPGSFYRFAALETYASKGIDVYQFKKETALIDGKEVVVEDPDCEGAKNYPHLYALDRALFVPELAKQNGLQPIGVSDSILSEAEKILTYLSECTQRYIQKWSRPLSYQEIKSAVNSYTNQWLADGPDFDPELRKHMMRWFKGALPEEYRELPPHKYEGNPEVRRRVNEIFYQKLEEFNEQRELPEEQKEI